MHPLHMQLCKSVASVDEVTYSKSNEQIFVQKVLTDGFCILLFVIVLVIIIMPSNSEQPKSLVGKGDDFGIISVWLMYLLR